MANKIVKDSGLPIFVKEITVPSNTLPNALVRLGSVAGLAGDYPRTGEDTLSYVSVDTAALIRIDAIALAFTDKAPVYMTSGGAIANATATGSFIIGYADRAKGAPSGPLFVQLDPGVKIVLP